MIVENDEDVENKITGTVVVRTFLGKSYQYEIETPLGMIVVNGSGDNVREPQDTMSVCLPQSKIVLV